MLNKAVDYAVEKCFTPGEGDVDEGGLGNAPKGADDYDSDESVTGSDTSGQGQGRGGSSLLGVRDDVAGLLLSTSVVSTMRQHSRNMIASVGYPVVPPHVRQICVRRLLVRGVPGGSTALWQCEDPTFWQDTDAHSQALLGRGAPTITNAAGGNVSNVFLLGVRALASHNPNSRYAAMYLGAIADVADGATKRFIPLHGMTQSSGAPATHSTPPPGRCHLFVRPGSSEQNGTFVFASGLMTLSPRLAAFPDTTLSNIANTKDEKRFPATTWQGKPGFVLLAENDIFVRTAQRKMKYPERRDTTGHVILSLAELEEVKKLLMDEFTGNFCIVDLRNFAVQILPVPPLPGARAESTASLQEIGVELEVIYAFRERAQPAARAQRKPAENAAGAAEARVFAAKRPQGEKFNW